MTLIEFGLILTGVLLNACAQLLLKAGVKTAGQFVFSFENILPIGWQLATTPAIVGGLACYVVSVVVWILALSRVDVTVAYPMLSIGYVVNAFLACWLLGEVLSPTRLAGIAIICFGVFIMSRS